MKLNKQEGYLALIRSPEAIASSDPLSGKTNPGTMIIDIHYTMPEKPMTPQGRGQF